MPEMVRYGILPNPYTPGVMIDFYGNPISSGGAGWPTVNGSGPGNLVAETATGDTVGYGLTDRGTGGIRIAATGTVNNPGIALLYSGTTVADNGGILLQDSSAASGGIELNVSNAANPGGIGLIDQGTGAAGIALFSANGGVNMSTAGAQLSVNPGGIGLTATAGTGGINIEDDTVGIALQESAAVVGNGIIINDTSSTQGIQISSSGSGNGGMALGVSGGTGPLAIAHSGTGGIAITPGSGGLTAVLPTSNPGGSGKLWNNGGVVNIT